MKKAITNWAGQNLYVEVGTKSFDKTLSFWGYQCFPILGAENKNHPAKWLFEKNEVENGTHNNGYPTLFLLEKEIKFLEA